MEFKKDSNDNPICKTEKETEMYRTDFWTLWEKARVGCSERIALKQVYYQGWNRSPAQVGCMRQVLRAGALGRPRGTGWRGRQEGGSGWGTHVNPWLIHVNAWQKPLQYCKVISLQLRKLNGKRKKENVLLYFYMQITGIKKITFWAEEMNMEPNHNTKITFSLMVLQRFYFHCP